MHRHKIMLQARLAGITRAVSAEAVPAPSSDPARAAGGTSAPATSLVSANKVAPAQDLQDTHGLQKLLAELARLVQEFQAQDRRTLGEVAQMSVELGAAIAERLVGAEIAANRQRLDRIVLGALDRMQAARSITLHGHPDDLALLARQIAEQADLERYRDVLTLRREETFQRGQWKLEADDWFLECDVPRCLAELRAALLEETFMDE